MSKMFQWRDREIDFFLYIETDKQPPGVIGFSFLVEAINQLLSTFSLGGGCGEAVGVSVFITHLYITHTLHILGFLGGCRSCRSYGSHIVYAKVLNGVKKCTLFGRDKRFVLLHLYSLTHFITHHLNQLNDSLTQLKRSHAYMHALTHFMIIDYRLWSFKIRGGCLNWSSGVNNDRC